MIVFVLVTLPVLVAGFALTLCSLAIAVYVSAAYALAQLLRGR